MKNFDKKYQMPSPDDIGMSLYNLIHYYLATSSKYSRLSAELVHKYAEQILEDIKEELK